MAGTRSDALVVFGVTGDLAHKQIFPALYAMEKRGALKAQVIGVAFPEVERGTAAAARGRQRPPCGGRGRAEEQRRPARAGFVAVAD